uniref:Peptidyl-prolyl cis-trans isomerase n=1 Tax=Leptothrix discophora TaxID=89 RepID=P71432_LEPDI|nr:mofB [Leptothrix discophora]
MNSTLQTLPPLRSWRAALLAVSLSALGGAALAQAEAAVGSAAAASAAAAPTRSAANPSGLNITREQISYATGVSTVRNFAKNKIEIDIDAVVRGMRDALAGPKALTMNDKEIRAAMNALQVELRRMDKQNRREAADTNIKRGSALQAEFKQQAGVVALSNGILYRELKAGNGAKPGDMDQVVVNYRGTLVDGTEFDATEPDRPVTLRLVNGIMGWREALKRMPMGAKWEIVIPYQLAYGERGVPGSIGPNETLVFEVELLDIKKPS